MLYIDLSLIVIISAVDFKSCIVIFFFRMVQSYHDSTGPCFLLFEIVFFYETLKCFIVFKFRLFDEEKQFTGKVCGTFHVQELRLFFYWNLSRNVLLVFILNFLKKFSGKVCVTFHFKNLDSTENYIALHLFQLNYSQWTCFGFWNTFFGPFKNSRP